MKVYCVFSLESPRGDSNENTKYTIFNIRRKSLQNYPKSAAMGFFPQRNQERVRNSRGKRAISVRAIEVLLYLASHSRIQKVIKIGYDQELIQSNPTPRPENHEGKEDIHTN